MKKSMFYGTVKNSLLVMQLPRMIRAFVATFEEETNIRVTIEKEYADKSDGQIGYYFAVVVKAGVKESGYTREEVDGIFCKFSLTKFAGTTKEYVKSKTKCSTVELNKLIDDSRDILARYWGVTVPDPDKNWKENKKNK